MIFIIVPVLFFLSIYYYYFVAHVPLIYSGNEKLRRFLTNHVTIVNRTYWPSLFLWDGRLQSVFGVTKRMSNSEKLPYRREILNLKDGGIVGLDFLEQEDFKQRDKRIFLILPGIMNNSQSSYVKTLALSIRKAGGNVVVFNFRGLGGVPLTTPRSFSGSNCEDLAEVVSYLYKTYKQKIVAVGTSMGGMVLGQYLTQDQYIDESKEKLKSVLLISTVLDSWAATRTVESPWLNLKLINYSIGQSMRSYVKKHRDIFEDRFDINKILSGKTIRDFDRSFTAPQFGYENIPDYYKSCSIWNKIHKISVPTFCLSAMDDPIMTGKGLPYKEAQVDGSNLTLIVTKRGGHLGFLEGVLPTTKPFHFMERFMSQFTYASNEYGVDLEDN